jgi:hypothetical protein
MNFDLAILQNYLAALTGQTVEITAVDELSGDAKGAEALKAFGYGRPLRVAFQQAGQTERVVLHQITRNGYGRERDSDRVAEVWLNYTTFNRLPRHAPALDIAAVDKTQRLVSLGGIDDLLLLTRYVPGQPYADDLMRIAQQGVAAELDVARVGVLAVYLAQIHSTPCDEPLWRPLLWRRRLRDLVGHGEGIFGLIDGYPADFAMISPAQFQTIEASANRWRWRLKPLEHRLAQVHGDFHPFNILFDQATSFHVLDRSRGAWGEPADDVSCLAINYLFFSLQTYGELSGPFVTLYHTLWEKYLYQRQDAELLNVIQPWFAWRALVLASPQWYPTQSNEVRRKLFNFAQNILHSERFEWEQINQYLG